MSPQSFPIVNQTAAEPIRLTKSGGQIFSEVTVEARPKLIERPRQDRGYAITRRYSKLGDDGKLTRRGELRVGDRILVTLDVEVRRRATYLAVEDPLPGVFEAINPAFKSQEVAGGRNARDGMGERLSRIARRPGRIFRGPALSRALHAALSCAGDFGRRCDRCLSENRGDVPSGAVRHDRDDACAAESLD